MPTEAGLMALEEARPGTRSYRAAAYQFEPVLVDKSADLARTDALVMRAAAEGAQLAVFQECLSLGYGVGRQVRAEGTHGEAVVVTTHGEAVVVAEIDLSLAARVGRKLGLLAGRRPERSEV
jgi:predicted amidohydrolase